jgi:hypothetical protein
LTSELHEGGGGFTLWPFYYGTSRPHDNWIRDSVGFNVDPAEVGKHLFLWWESKLIPRSFSCSVVNPLTELSLLPFRCNSCYCLLFNKRTASYDYFITPKISSFMTAYWTTTMQLRTWTYVPYKH